VITTRNARHSRIRTLSAQWLRKHKPIIYRMLAKKAAEQYPTNSNSSKKVSVDE
jgi:hypothetical protein